MITNYLRTAWRNLIKHKGYSAINISGLAVGLAACLLLFIIVRYELSYDHFQPQFGKIYRITTEDKFPSGNMYNSGVPYPLADALRLDIPSVTFGEIYSSNGNQVTVPGENGNPDKKFIEDLGLVYASPKTFEIFQYHFLSGGAAVLADPSSCVLTQASAEKYFGNWQASIGKTVRLDNAITLKVAAVMETPPRNSDFPFRFIASYEACKKNPGVTNYSTDWGNTSSNNQLYALLPASMTEENFAKQLVTFSRKQYKDRSKTERTQLPQPLSKIHFDSRYDNLGDHTTSEATITTLILVGVLILVMACINFINLSTAKAVSRSREIGVRKVLGGSRLQLFFQMMGETGFVVFISLLLALGIAKIVLPYISNIASVQEQLPLFTPGTLSFLLVTGVLVTLFSGSYPAMVLSGFKPVLALKNKITSATAGGISLRRGLVILQFSISQVLVIGTLVAISQMNYIRDADLGYRKDALYLLSGNTDSVSISKLSAFKHDLLQIHGVTSVSLSSDAPSSDNNWSTNFSYDNGKDQDYHLYLKFADEDYVSTYGLQLAAGRNYIKSDTLNEILINETLVQKLGLQRPEEVIGHRIRMGSNPWKQIVGVVKDFKTNSLRESIKPTMIATKKKYYGLTGIKLSAGGILSARKEVEATWNKYFPEYAFTANFLDDNIAKFYRQETQLSLLYKIFAGLAIFISCLGLYGLVSFMAVQKTKEVGVRKVLGASVAQIIYLFSKEFTVLIALAFLVAAPVAWYLMSNWLGNFVYRISIGVSVFALAVCLSVIIAWLTVGYRAVKAAVVNPVKSLRSE